MEFQRPGHLFLCPHYFLPHFHQETKKKAMIKTTSKHNSIECTWTGYMQCPISDAIMSGVVFQNCVPRLDHFQKRQKLSVVFFPLNINSFQFIGSPPSTVEQFSKQHNFLAQHQSTQCHLFPSAKFFIY